MRFKRTAGGIGRLLTNLGNTVRSVMRSIRFAELRKYPVLTIIGLILFLILIGSLMVLHLQQMSCYGSNIPIEGGQIPAW